MYVYTHIEASVDLPSGMREKHACTNLVSCPDARLLEPSLGRLYKPSWGTSLWVMTAKWVLRHDCHPVVFIVLLSLREVLRIPNSK